MQSKGNKVKINGIALDNKTVADFMVRLENCDLFKEVDLKNLKHKKLRNSKLKSFQITCIKKPLIKPQKENQPKKQAKAM